MVDALSERAGGQKTTVACVYFDFAAQEEQSPAAILGSMLKQIVSGLHKIPRRVVEAFQDRGKVIGGQRLVVSEIVELLQDISSSQSTFLCIDAIDECQARHRVKFLDSLNQILRSSPGVRIFVTGRPGVRDEVARHLPRRAIMRSIIPTKDDITIFLREKLKEDKMPDAMDESLGEEIITTIPETVTKM